MIKLSIIIPVYNTEEYVTRCIESCLSQTIDNSEYEVIIVDDGSTDNSLQIARSFEDASDNITVIAQCNQKQGTARNNGLKIAQGEYIWFVDSDDWLETDACGVILDFFSNHDIEILRFDAMDHKKNMAIARPCKHIPNHLYTRHEVLVENEFSVCTPFHVFKKSFLLDNNLYFIENIYYEDNEFMLRVVERVNFFYYLKKTLYHVFNREVSTTRSVNYDRYFDLITVIKAHIDHSERNLLDSEARKIFAVHAGRCMNNLLEGTARSPDHFHSAVKALEAIDDLKEYINISGSLFHAIEYHCMKFPTVLRILLLFYYRK